jgi:hypothetical protein
MQRTRTRRRPCKICRKWFLPDSRQIGRQKTCGDPACQKENHRRQCAKWNRTNRDYFKANYLSEKLARTKAPPTSKLNKAPVVIPSSRINLDLPKDLLVEIIGVRHLILLEYIIAQVMRHGKGPSSVRAP